MKILLIGLGRWGKNHLRTLMGLVDEVYVADLDGNQLDGIPIPSNHFSTKYQDFLDKVDAVDIVTPADSHFSICKECIEKGKDVFVEKPFTLTSVEAKEIVDLANKSEIILQVGHIYRYHVATLEVKKLIDEGKLGTIRYAYGHFVGFKRPRMDVGVTQTDAIHHFDLFNYFLGALPDSVMAVTRNYLGLPLDDTSISVLDYQGRIVTINASYLSPEKKRDFVIVGDYGSLYCELGAGFLNYCDNHYENGVPIEGVIKPIHVRPDKSLAIELQAFVNSVKTRSNPLADGKVGYEALKMVEACYESSRGGKKVEIKW